MAVSYTNSVKVSRMTSTRDFFSGGTLEIMTASDVVLAIFTLTSGSGSVAGAGVWTLEFVSATATAIAGGVASKARMKNSGGSIHLTGLTVGTSGSDIVLNDTNIVNGQLVNLPSATITHA